MRITVAAVVLVGWSCWAQPKRVAFSAPESWRAPLTRELQAKGAEALDLSLLDDALFGPSGFKTRFKANKPPVFDAVLPAEVKNDLEVGLAGCASRGKLSAGGRDACGEQLCSATWQRHLRRLAVDLVIEVRSVEGLPMLEWGSYGPTDEFLRGGVVETLDPGVAPQVVEPALRRDAGLYAVRASLDELPGKTPLPPHLLSSGAAQELEALEVDRRCVFPARLKVTPEKVPFAVTLSRLWATSVSSQTNPRARPVECRLSLTSARFAVQCGSFAEVLPLPVGVRFDSAQLQKMVAQGAVRRLLELHCLKD